MPIIIIGQGLQQLVCQDKRVRRGNLGHIDQAFTGFVKNRLHLARTVIATFIDPIRKSHEPPNQIKRPCWIDRPNLRNDGASLHV
nr:hypothetical protein [Sulfitobacter pacificus]